MEANSHNDYDKRLNEPFDKLMLSVSTRGTGMKTIGKAAVLWLTGKPGFGKSRTAKDLANFVRRFGVKYGYKDVVVIHLDTMLKEVNGQEAFKAGANPSRENRLFYLVDVPKVIDQVKAALSANALVILEGICDNGKALDDVLSSLQVVHVVVKPDFHVWKAAIGRRLELDARAGGKTLTNLHIWNKFHRMNEREFEVMVKRFTVLTSSRKGTWTVLKIPVLSDPTDTGYTVGSGHTWKAKLVPPAALPGATRRSLENQGDKDKWLLDEFKEFVDELVISPVDSEAPALEFMDILGLMHLGANATVLSFEQISEALVPYVKSVDWASHYEVWARKAVAKKRDVITLEQLKAQASRLVKIFSHGGD